MQKVKNERGLRSRKNKLWCFAECATPLLSLTIISKLLLLVLGSHGIKIVRRIHMFVTPKSERVKLRIKP